MFRRESNNRTGQRTIAHVFQRHESAGEGEGLHWVGIEVKVHRLGRPELRRLASLPPLDSGCMVVDSFCCVVKG
jgi:hypothetical protein